MQQVYEISPLKNNRDFSYYLIIDMPKTKGIISKFKA